MIPKFGYRYLFFILIISMLGLGGACKESSHTPNDETEIAKSGKRSSQEIGRSAGQQKVQGKGRQAVGKGTGRKGAGRRARQ